MWILGKLSMPYEFLLEIFYRVDVDKDSAITFNEFDLAVLQLVGLAAFHRTTELARAPVLGVDGVFAALHLAGLEINPGRLGDICRAADTKYDGQIDWREFWRLFPQVRHELHATPDHIISAFRQRVGTTSEYARRVLRSSRRSSG